MSVDGTTDDEIPSQLWKGHVWKVSEPCQLEMLELLEPEVYKQYLRPSINFELELIVSES